MDFYGKLRITMKGPNSLGGSNVNNISAKYRGINPSYIGRLDLNACGSSDPGTSAILTPQCETYGLYFSPEHEPENFKYVLDKDIYNSIIKQTYDIFITGSFDSMEEYFDYHASVSDTADTHNIHLIELSPDYTDIESIYDDEDDDESINEYIDED